MDKILADDHCRGILDRAGIVDAVRVTTKLLTIKDVRDERMDMWQAICKTGIP